MYLYLLLLIAPTPYPFGFGVIDLISILCFGRFSFNFLNKLRISAAELTLIAFLTFPFIFHFSTSVGDQVIGFLGSWRSVLPFFVAKFFRVNLDKLRNALFIFFLFNLILGILQKYFGGEIKVLIENIWYEDFNNRGYINGTGTFGNYAYYAAGMTILVTLIFQNNILGKILPLIFSVIIFQLSPILTYVVAVGFASIFGFLPINNFKSIHRKNLTRFLLFIILFVFLSLFLVNYGPSKIKDFYNFILSFGEISNTLPGSLGSSIVNRQEVSFAKNIDLFLSSPLVGVGFGQAADSLWLSLFTTFGILGFFLFILFFILIFKAKSYSKSGSLIKNYYSFLIPTVIISSLTQYPIFGGLAGQLFWFITGVVYYENYKN